MKSGMFEWIVHKVINIVYGDTDRAVSYLHIF